VRLPAPFGGLDRIRDIDPASGRVRVGGFYGNLGDRGGWIDPAVLEAASAGSSLNERRQIARTRTPSPTERGDRTFQSVVEQEDQAFSPEVKAALVRYSTGDASSPTEGTPAMTAFDINRGLRAGDASNPDIALLDQAAATGPGFPARGGEGLAHRIIPLAALDALPARGGEYVDPAFVSTATDVGEIPRDAYGKGKYGKLEILIPDGFPGFTTSTGFDPGHWWKPSVGGHRQSEWVLPRGTRFKVLSKGKDKAVLEVVPPSIETAGVTDLSGNRTAVETAHGTTPGGKATR
jgi:hypothetical protein